MSDDNKVPTWMILLFLCAAVAIGVWNCKPVPVTTVTAEELRQYRALAWDEGFSEGEHTVMTAVKQIVEDTNPNREVVIRNGVKAAMAAAHRNPYNQTNESKLPRPAGAAH